MAPPSRDEVLARYRRLREVSTRHHRDVLKFISRDTILHYARRLGLAYGNTLVLDDEEQVNYAFDLAIHTAPADRSRAIDRYAGSVRLRLGPTRCSCSMPCGRRASRCFASRGGTRSPA